MNSASRLRASSSVTVLTAVACFFLLQLVAAPASGQDFHWIQTFTADGNGASPLWSPTVDGFGNVYVTTEEGGILNCGFGDFGCGVVTRGTFRQGTWIWTKLYSFSGGMDGISPSGPVTLARSGAVYGVADAPNWGLVYQLRPSATRQPSAVSPWNETVLFRFGSEESGIPAGPIVFDTAGNLYGTTVGGFGTVYQLRQAQGQWTESILYSFQGGTDGIYPAYGVVMDANGNIYGVTAGDGNHCGTIFELVNTGSNWTKTTLYQFQGLADGCYPNGPLVRDSLGNLFGNASSPFGFGPSVVYELSPGSGSWTLSVIKSFSEPSPLGSVAVDGAGDVYATVAAGERYPGDQGGIFKFTSSGGEWLFTSLHDFTTSENVGLNGVVLDSQGNLFGSTEGGGPNGPCRFGCGTVWELTP